MTDLGTREQKSNQGQVFEANESRSGWSLFDDISWTDFSNGADSFSVPQQDGPGPAWLPARRKEGTKLAKDEVDSSNRNSMDVDNWDVADLGAVPDNLMTGDSLVKDGRSSEEETLLGLSEEDGRNSSHFAFPDVASAVEIGGLFGGENDVDKGGTLLQYAWETLGDMDDIFQNGGSSFAPDADALLQWPCSSTSPDSNNVEEKASGELRAMKGKTREEDLKMEFIPCESFESNKELNSDDTGGAGSKTDVPVSQQELSDKVLDTAGDPAVPAVELSGPAKDYKLHVSTELDKTYPAKRQALSRKRSEDRFRKHSQQKRLSEDYTKHQQPLFASTQPLQIKPGVSNMQNHSAPIPPAMLTMQQTSQPVTYASSVYGVAHHSPYLRPAPQQALQQGLLRYQHDPHMLKPQYDPGTRQKMEVLAPPPASGSNMTPQEKIEKLRWKQKMNRIASERQHMAKQCAQSAKSSEGSLEDADGKVVDATVLNQLLGIMSKLDVGTRICIRDSLYRLAKNAMDRHASDGASSSETSPSPGSERDSLRKHIRLPLLETVTNPLDRTIANLLFHKRPANPAPAEATWLMQPNCEEAGPAGSGGVQDELGTSIVGKHEAGATSSEEFWSGQCNTSEHSNMEE